MDLKAVEMPIEYLEFLKKYEKLIIEGIANDQKGTSKFLKSRIQDSGFNNILDLTETETTQNLCWMYQEYLRFLMTHRQEIESVDWETAIDFEEWYDKLTAAHRRDFPNGPGLGGAL